MKEEQSLSTRVETCGNCEHYFETDPDQNLQRSTICRRYPPHPFPMNGPRGQMATISIYPAVQTQHWCGEWKKSTRIVLQ